MLSSEDFIDEDLLAKNNMSMDDVVSISIKPLYGATRNLIICLTVDPINSTLLPTKPSGRTVRDELVQL